MIVTDDDLADLVGTVEYRARAVQDAINTGRAGYGPIVLGFDDESQMLSIEAPFFSTVIDVAQLSRDGSPSVSETRQKVDEITKEECEQMIENKFWE